ncbi:MAG: hypothetical protein Q9174_006169, partial [Haloplaca sp. 1 TL-2023]
EYIGYYVHDSPPAPPYRDVPSMPQVPIYNDLQHARPPRPDFSRLRNAPRSPSPSQSVPHRDRSQSVQSAASAPSMPMLLNQAHHPTPSSRLVDGPIIANGSDGWEFNDYSTPTDSTPISRSSTMNTMNSSVEESSYQYPPVTSVSTRNGRPDPGYRNPNRPMPAYPMPEVPRAADLMRSSRAEQLLRSPPPASNGVNPMESPARTRVESNRISNGLGIQYEASKLNGNTSSAENGSAQAVIKSAKQVQPVEAKAEKPIEDPKSPLKVPPLLSPVREVRSPSPATILRRRGETIEQRKPVVLSTPKDLVIPPFSAERHAQRKQREALLRNMNGSATPPSANSTEAPNSLSSPTRQQILPPSQPQPEMNGWQQMGRKGKKSKGHSAKTSTDITGEPIPVDVADRKGG